MNLNVDVHLTYGRDRQLRLQAEAAAATLAAASPRRSRLGLTLRGAQTLPATALARRRAGELPGAARTVTTS